LSPQQVNASGIGFDTQDDSDLSVIAMEFAAAADFGPTSPLSADDEAVLAGIAERLRGHDKIDRFGVKLIRNPLALTEDELLLETCDSAVRTLYCDISSRDALSADLDIIETTWRWNVVKGEGGLRRCRNAPRRASLLSQRVTTSGTGIPEQTTTTIPSARFIPSFGPRVTAESRIALSAAGFGCRRLDKKDRCES
jgi:hypothetical protein